MKPLELAVGLVVYWLPIVYFLYMGIDVMLRNAKKTEHRLVGVTVVCYIMLFLEEWVRYQLPLAYSPILSAIWFSNVGIVIPGVGFHFLAKFSGLDKRMSKWLYPYLFYLPLLFVPLTLISSRQLISAQVFAQAGLWKWPEYNLPYYSALTASILFSLLYLVVLHDGRARATSPGHRKIYSLLALGVLLVFAWHVVFGYFRFGEKLPPYPYLYAGLIWCFILRLAMRRFDFLDFMSRRYEKLFNLNPTAILLVSLSGRIREANPGARGLFNSFHLAGAELALLGGEELLGIMQSGQQIRSLETTLRNGRHRMNVLVDGDYVSLDGEPHVFLIIRDMTQEKASREQITFLAYHDALTRLANRPRFYDKLDEAIQTACMHGRKLAVILIDLDEFKEINDTYGHEAGDEALRHAAGIITESVGCAGMAARLGGDEFALFVDSVSSPASVRELIGQIQRQFLHTRIPYGEAELAVAASIGASIYPDDGQDAKTLLHCADAAMYRAKRSGRKSSAAGLQAASD